MQKRKKQLLGLVGLVVVAAMTFLAYSLPAPNASAANSQSTKVRVEVVKDGTEIEVTSIESGDVIVTRKLKFTYQYKQATHVRIFIKNLGAVTRSRAGSITPEEGEVEIPLAGSQCKDGNGNPFTMGEDQKVSYSQNYGYCDKEYELPGDLIGENGVNFVMRAVAYNDTISSLNENNVDFIYRAAKFEGETTYDDQNGDPIVKIAMAGGVKNGKIIVLDKDGKPIFGNTGTETGDHEAIPFTGCSFGENLAEPCVVDVPLPFSGKNIESGEYQIVLVAYDGTKDDDGNDKIAALAYTTADYDASKDNNGGDPSHPGGPSGPGKPTDPDNPDDPNNPSKPGETPEVPDTGLNFLNGLNISQRDYIITGLIAFGSVVGFAIFLIVRRNKR